MRGFGSFVQSAPRKTISCAGFMSSNSTATSIRCFVLSWILFHVIDKDSPLHGLTEFDLADSDALLVLNVSGVDDSSAQQLYVRRVYSWRDVRWQHRYKDITSVSAQGRVLLDYTKFDDLVPEE